MRRLSVVSLIATASVLFVSGAALAADLPNKAPVAAGCVQAVDGVNAKISGWGGSFSDEGIGGASGSVSMPIGCGWGVQFDASAASFDSRFLGSLGGHLFWRDPSKALLGAYAAGTYWDQAGGVKIGHLGAEGELYLNRFTLQGLAGVEFGNDTTGGGLTIDTKTRFFDIANVAFYPTDNLKLYVGHRYLAGNHAAAFGAELGIPMQHGMMAALFAEGVAGEHDSHGVIGGLRLYFGQKDKSLIRRHREDDPTDWMSGLSGAGATSGNSSSGTLVCTPPAILINGVCAL
ncbi:MAG TPA: hypothetical protein VHD59_03240 [Pseudolabrys sp.]|jgi:hypothetical protein|nr:hypothetical protein [Pseudolabrys sp.]